MRKIIFYAILSVILIIVGAKVIYKGKLQYSGYCIRFDRYLTDQEKFDAVVGKVVRGDRTYQLTYTLDEHGKRTNAKNEQVEQYKYQSMEEFYELNPNCCEFVDTMSHEGAIPIFDSSRRKGLLNAFVDITYLSGYGKEDGRPVYITNQYGVSNCGRILTGMDVVIIQSKELNQRR